MLYCLYRLSDKGNPKNKLENATKMNCLDNFLSEFGNENTIVIADNCEQKTIDDIKKRNVSIIETSLGVAKGILFAFDYAVQNFKEDDFVYFVEDDYFHKKGSKQTLLEGFGIADYVTLYDHPDKYVDFEKGGDNPLINNGGETGKMLLTKSTHWKTTNSTTMTFAAKVKTLIEDKKIFYSAYNGKTMLGDFYLFRILTKNFLNIKDLITFYHFGLKKRRLIASIPGFSTHCELKYLSPLTDWRALE